MDQLNIAIIQATIVWQDANQNRTHFLDKINEIEEQVDLIVLPEMFSTGFSMQPKNIAESMQGETVEWMRKIASEKKCAIAGSIIISEENNFYNRFLFVFPSGEIEFYDKRHLFTLAKEELTFSAGAKKLIIDYKGWKICPLVCYDLRFPVWSRNIENYDLLLYVANWPKPRIVAWDALLKARSIENLCYTVGVNRVGVDSNKLEYSGHSAVYNCLGDQIVHTTPNHESVEVISLSKTHVDEVRKKLNFLNDKDFFEIKV